jgi:hypothetical protein
MPFALSALSALPGYEIVARGLEDLRHGRETIESLVVSMAVERLEALGYAVPPAHTDPELRLFRRLAAEVGDGAHSRYNAYRRRLSSFLRAASCSVRACATSSTPSESTRS